MHAKVGRASAGSDLVTSGSGIVSQLSRLHRASRPARQGRSVVSVRSLRDPSCAHSGLTGCPRAPRQAAVISSGSQTRTIPYVEKPCKQWCNWAQTTMHLAHRIDGSIQGDGSDAWETCEMLCLGGCRMSNKIQLRGYGMGSYRFYSGDGLSRVGSCGKVHAIAGQNNSSMSSLMRAIGSLLQLMKNGANASREGIPLFGGDDPPHGKDTEWRRISLCVCVDDFEAAERPSAAWPGRGRGPRSCRSALGSRGWWARWRWSRRSLRGPCRYVPWSSSV